MRRCCLSLLVAACTLPAQVDSPKVLKKGQPDSTSLRALAAGIYASAGAHGPRERAEAIWRFFLTDGRFVAPGFWYHIAGWAYEEPQGEVLDPLKLLNSYGFGLCYQIAPLLADVWKAGGFEDARVWFLTGHTVAEVFYDGAYHHFDSDMMGYNTMRSGSVASVRQLEQDGKIILSGLAGPVADPWYPADVRAGAIPDLAAVFTSTSDNHLFPFERAPQGHSMDFTLRPGERLIRSFEPERADLFYLPYKFTGASWEEFPQEVAQYKIRTTDGPRSQKDARRWATGRFEYRPPRATESAIVYPVRSPYVIIDAEFQLDATLTSANETIIVDTSSDEGLTWSAAATLRGPHRGRWTAEPAVLTRSSHGRRTAVSGLYSYLVRIRRTAAAQVNELLLLTRVQLNPRTLPALVAGHNELVYTSNAPLERVTVPVALPAAKDIAHRARNARYIESGGQGYWTAAGAGLAEFVFRLSGEDLAGIDAGARFLDLSSGWAPDKFTAEIRLVPALANRGSAASIAWSRSPDGPFEVAWTYSPGLSWRDGVPIDRNLLWQEVDRHLDIPDARQVYVRYLIQGLAIDGFRLATVNRRASGQSAVVVTHQWREGDALKSAAKSLPPGTRQAAYSIDVPPGATVRNMALILESK